MNALTEIGKFYELYWQEVLSSYGYTY